MGLIHSTKTFTVASGGTSGYVEVESFPILGLLVPTLTSTTLQFKVSEDASTWYPVQDGEGVEILDFGDAATTGAFAVSSRELTDALAYKYLGVFCGTAQDAARTFTLKMKTPYTR